LFPAQVRDRLLDDALIRRGISGAGNLVKGAVGGVVGGISGAVHSGAGGGDRNASTLTMEKEQLVRIQKWKAFVNSTKML
jgi:hypothetical protein